MYFKYAVQADTALKLPEGVVINPAFYGSVASYLTPKLFYSCLNTDYIYIYIYGNSSGKHSPADKLGLSHSHHFLLCRKTMYLNLAEIFMM